MTGVLWSGVDQLKVLLAWENEACLRSRSAKVRSTFQVKGTSGPREARLRTRTVGITCDVTFMGTIIGGTGRFEGAEGTLTGTGPSYRPGASCGIADHARQASPCCGPSLRAKLG
jgi:hypothetical protein